MTLREIKYESFGIYERQTKCKDLLEWLESVEKENDWYEYNITVVAYIAQKGET